MNLDWLHPASASLVGRTGTVAIEAIDVRGFERQAAAIFKSEVLTDPNSAFARACDGTLLLFQAVAACIVIAALLHKVRQDHAQLEGIASVLLKVAFIATIPFWQARALETADVAARAIGYRAATLADRDGGITPALWDVFGQWAPPSSPRLDALEAQSGDRSPASGEEATWSLSAWNWARGVGATSANGFSTDWQTATGSLRGLLLAVGCTATAFLVAVTLFVVYLGEFARVFLCSAGFAVLPLFIAGLGSDFLRSASSRFLLGLTTIVCWPIGWGLSAFVTRWLLTSWSVWAKSLCAAAAGVNVDGAFVPPLAVAAPDLAWGVLILLGAFALVVCGWTLVTTVVAPYVMAKWIGTGSHAAGGVAALLVNAVSRPAHGSPTRGAIEPRVRLSAAPTRPPLTIPTPAIPRGPRFEAAPRTPSLAHARDRIAVVGRRPGLHSPLPPGRVGRS